MCKTYTRPTNALYLYWYTFIGLRSSTCFGHSCGHLHGDFLENKNMIIIKIWRAVQIIKLLIMLFSPLPCYLVSFRPKYSPQHPILKSPQPTFPPQCERRSFTPIQNNRQNYSSLYFYLSTFLLANWKTKNSSPTYRKHTVTSICS